MRDRIEKIIKEEGFTATKFADEIGVQASSVSHILSGRNNPSLDFIIKIIERFRGINPEWLLTGKGEMYKSTTREVEPTEKKSYSQLPPDLFSTNILNSDPGQPYGNSKKIEPIENSAEELNITPQENIPEKSSKTIERIVVFFTDKSFDYYIPNK